MNTIGVLLLLWMAFNLGFIVGAEFVGRARTRRSDFSSDRRVW